MYILVIEDPKEGEALSRCVNLSKEEADEVYKLAVNDPENEKFDVSILKLVKVRYADNAC